MSTIRRAASDDPRLPVPRQAASLLTAFAMVAAGLGVAAGLQFATAASGTITGTVFEDYDADGAIDTREPGVAGVTVTAVDADGNRTLDVVTDAEGTYEIDLGVVAVDDLGPGPYRVEFSGWPAHLEEGPVGPDSGSSIQFAGADSIGVSLGLAAPSDYCHDNPEIAASCFVYAGLPDADSWAAVVSVGWDWTDNNSTRNPNGPTDWMRDGDGAAVGETVLATIGQVGSVWGEAWDRDTGVIYVGAFVKRHTELGPTGNPTTIYRIATNGTPNDTSDDVVEPWVTIDGAAPDPHSGASDGWHQDFEAFDDVYRSGLGDVELSRDGSTIYAIDLRNRTLVSIPVEADGSAGTPVSQPIVDRMGLADGYTATDGSCAHADLQPAGLGVDADGRVHVGVVCTAASTIDPADYGVDGTLPQIDGWDAGNVGRVPGDPFALHGYVVEWDGQPGGSFTAVTSFPLDGERGCIAFGGGCPFGGDSEWRPWVDHYPYQVFEDSYPQPVLTDIDFDNDTMLIAIGDRWGHQSGPETFMRKPDGATLRFRHPVTGGDLKRACSNGDGTYAFEGTPGCSQSTSAYGEPEFFFDDRYRGTHLETGLGSVAVAPGFDRFIHTQMDPVNAGSTWRSGGFAWTNPDTGAKGRGLRIYDGRNHTPSGTFEKASGVGDVELLCESAPLTIGNRIWLDLDGDGIQDADEPGIDGVTVDLALADGTFVTSTTTGPDATGAAGSWSFAIEPGVAYEVTVDASTAVDLPLGITVDELALTGADAGDDRLDSDADTDGTIVIAARGAGEHDHSLDVGFVPVPPAPAIDIEKYVASENGVGPLVDADSVGDDAGVAWYLPEATVTYEIRLRNTGAVALTDVVVSDPVAPDCARTIETLAIDASMSWSCTLDLAPGTTSLVNKADAATTWTPPYGPGMDAPQPVSDLDDAMVRVANAAITVEKSADQATPYAPGDDAVYTYRVTATGDVDLALGTPPRITDDKCDSITSIGSPINDGDLDNDGVLDVAADLVGLDDGAAEVWLFRCTTTVAEDDLDRDGDGLLLPTLTNVVDVTGTPVDPAGVATGLPDVRDDDDETIRVFEPAIRIETQVLDPVTGTWRNADALDGETGDDAVTVDHHVDTTAEYRYVVRNTGNVALADPVISDSGAHITECALPRTLTGTTLQPDEQIIVAGDGGCLSGVLSGDGFAPGTVLASTGQVRANPVDSDGADIATLADATDNDPASITLVEAAISIVKRPGLQTLAPGGNAEWTFSVTNTSIGIDELEDVEVADVSSIGLDCVPTLDSGDFDDDARLDHDETWVFSCAVAGIAESGTDTATVTGAVPDGVPTPPIPDEADAWTVTDADDAAHQVGALGVTKQVRIVDVNAHTDDAAAAGAWSDDVIVRVDESVEFRVVVANLGDVAMIDVAVVDDRCSLALHEILGDESGSSDDTEQLRILSPDETWEYRCTSSNADETTVENVATASGSVVADPTVAEADMVAGDPAPDVAATASYTTIEPRLAVHLYWDDAGGAIDADGDAGTQGTNDPTAPVHVEGESVVATIVVTNTGTATVHDVALIHDLPDAASGAVCSSLSGSLMTMSPGAQYVLSCTFPAGAVGADHVATVSATSSSAPDGRQTGAVVADADDSDAATSVVATVDLSKQVVVGDTAVDADTEADAVAILEGTSVTWRLTVTNTGAVDLVDVLVTDPIDLDGDGSPDCGPFTVDADGPLAVGESRAVDCVTGPVGGPLPVIENIAVVTADAVDPANGPDAVVTVRDADPANVRIRERASIGDRVWHDLDGDGIQETDEPGLGGIGVELLDGSGEVVSSTSTDADGRYAFTELVPGLYQVRVAVPEGWTVSPAGAGVDRAIDSDLSAAGLTVATLLDPGEADLTIDGGLHQPAEIGDFVWYDADADGIQDDGEAGIPGVVVSLLVSPAGDDDGGSAEVILTTETDADGGYRFSGLAPGTYTVVFATPDGMVRTPTDAGTDDTLDSDAVDASSPGSSRADGSTVSVDLVSGSTVLDLDAGFYEPASIGNLIWVDADEDGFQDEDEVGAADVVVRLLDADGIVLASTTTNAAGRYEFTCLAPGTYQIEVVPPSGMIVTDPDLDPGDQSDSDLHPVSGRTALTVLEGGEDDRSWDGGLVVPTVVLSTPNDLGTPTLAFTGRTVAGLAAAGLLLLGLGGTLRILSDRVRSRPTLA